MTYDPAYVRECWGRATASTAAGAERARAAREPATFAAVAAALTAEREPEPCEPIPHEPHADEYGACPGFTGPPSEGWAEHAAEADAYERCLVAGFEHDPITRSASLDAGEKRPIVRELRERCAATGCVLCNADAGCYFCHRDAGGDVHEQDSSKLPRRRIVDEWTTGGADPTAVLVLSCGHSII